MISAYVAEAPKFLFKVVRHQGELCLISPGFIFAYDDRVPIAGFLPHSNINADMFIPHCISSSEARG